MAASWQSLTERMAWEREDEEFMAVAAVDRWRLPSANTAATSSTFATLRHVSPGMRSTPDHDRNSPGMKPTHDRQHDERLESNDAQGGRTGATDVSCTQIRGCMRATCHQGSINHGREDGRSGDGDPLAPGVT